MKYIVKYIYQSYDFGMACLIAGLHNLFYYLGWPIWHFNFNYDKEWLEDERQIYYWSAVKPNYDKKYWLHSVNVQLFQIFGGAIILAIILGYTLTSILK